MSCSVTVALLATDQALNVVVGLGGDAGVADVFCFGDGGDVAILVVRRINLNHFGGRRVRRRKGAAGFAVQGASAVELEWVSCLVIVKPPVNL
jgi:hypothetical protein